MPNLGTIPKLVWRENRRSISKYRLGASWNSDGTVPISPGWLSANLPRTDFPESKVDLTETPAMDLEMPQTEHSLSRYNTEDNATSVGGVANLGRPRTSFRESAELTVFLLILGRPDHDFKLFRGIQRNLLITSEAELRNEPRTLGSHTLKI